MRWRYREILLAYLRLLLSRACYKEERENSQNFFNNIMIRITQLFFSNHKQDDPLFLRPSKKTNDFLLSIIYNKNIVEDRNVIKYRIFTLCMLLFIK